MCIKCIMECRFNPTEADKVTVLNQKKNTIWTCCYLLFVALCFQAMLLHLRPLEARQQVTKQQMPPLRKETSPCW